MKICFLNAWGNGSTGRIVEQLAKECVRRNDEYLFLYGRGKSNLENAVCMNTKANLYFDALCSRLFDNQGLNSKTQTKRIIKKIEDFSPDIIHIHNLHGYWINYKILFDYIKENDIRVVWTLHDSWPLTGHCACYSYLECKNFNNGCGKCPGYKEYPKALFDYSQNRLSDKIIAFRNVNRMVFAVPSEWMKKNVEGSELSSYPIIVIHNQINSNVFCYQKDSNIREKLGISANKKIVLYVAMNTRDPWKGFDIFKDAIQMLSDEYYVVIVGECDISNSDRVFNLGRISDQKKLAQIYSASDVLANPSLDDNYPTVNLEALACGLPVAAFETGGIPEQIDSTCGCLSAEKSASALVSSIRKVIALDRNDIRECCFRKYESISGKHSFIEEYFNLFDKSTLEH